MKELRNWITSKPLAWPDKVIQEEKRRVVSTMVEAGISLTVIADAWKQHEKTLKGTVRERPRKRREMAVKALEMRLAEPNLSWNQLAIKLCPCGGTHGPRCRESLHQQVMALEKVLKKYNIPFQTAPTV